jgi:large subunit ribosomal protein L20
MRVKGGVNTRKKHKKILSATKGMRDMRKRSVRRAKEAILKSGANAYIDRRKKKRDFRSLWNIRISAACKASGTSYSKFIASLKSASIEIDRKVLAELAVESPQTFEALIDRAKTK